MGVTVVTSGGNANIITRTSLKEGLIFVGNANNQAVGVEMSGDATINSSGVVTVTGGGEVPTSTYFYVDDYGGVGDGVTDDTQAIKDTIAASGGVGRVVFFTAGKTYLVSKPITSNSCVMMGYGATIKRSDAKVTTLTAQVDAGSNTIPVVDASIFELGDEIIATDDSLTFGGIGYSETSAAQTNQAHTITDITDNTITINNTFQATIPIGNVVFTVFDLIGSSSAVEPIDYIGLSFDGNKANNQHTVSWVFNYLIKTKGRGIIKDCHFYDIPTTAILCGGDRIVSNCLAQNVNGSFIHQSTTGQEGSLIITGNNLRNIGIYAEASSHNEAVVTFSNLSLKIIISDNNLDVCGGAFFGKVQGGSDQATADQKILVSNNRCNDLNSIAQIWSTTSSIIEDITITNNQFINYGILESIANTSSETHNGFGCDSINISGNLFVNGYLYFRYVSNLCVSNNTITQRVGYAGCDKVIALVRVLNYVISDNVISALSNNCIAAIDYDAESAVNGTLIKTDASTNSIYKYYARNSSISNNVISGCYNGIINNRALTDFASREHSYINMQINDNQIQMSDSSSANVGIIVWPGCVARNNTVVGDSNSSIGINVSGAKTSGLLFAGGIVIGNIVKGIGTPIKIGTFNAAYNTVVKDNIIDRALLKQSASTPADVDTIILTETEVIPIQLPRENPEFY